MKTKDVIVLVLKVIAYAISLILSFVGGTLAA